MKYPRSVHPAAWNAIRLFIARWAFCRALTLAQRQQIVRARAKLYGLGPEVEPLIFRMRRRFFEEHPEELAKAEDRRDRRRATDRERRVKKRIERRSAKAVACVKAAEAAALPVPDDPEDPRNSDRRVCGCRHNLKWRGAVPWRVASPRDIDDHAGNRLVEFGLSYARNMSVLPSEYGAHAPRRRHYHTH